MAAYDSVPCQLVQFWRSVVLSIEHRLLWTKGLSEQMDSVGYYAASCVWDDSGFNVYQAEKSWGERG